MTVIILSDNGSPLRIKCLSKFESFKAGIQLNKSEVLVTGRKLFKFSTQSNSTFFPILDLLQLLKQFCCSILLEPFIFFVFSRQASYWWEFSLSSVDSEEASLKLSSIYSVVHFVSIYFRLLFRIGCLMVKENGSLYLNTFQTAASQNCQK